jgi:regulator of RNase E activity RraA
MPHENELERKLIDNLTDEEGVSRLPVTTLVALKTQVRSALIADALDSIDMRAQCLKPGFQPLSQGDIIVGYAFPVQIRKVDAKPPVPYIGLLAALDAIGEGEVFVAATGGVPDVAIWGELVTTSCLAAGAVGAVCDGYARDTAVIRGCDFPVVARGTVPFDSNGRSEVVRHGVEVEIDGVSIHPGDLIVADDDGVVVIPSRHIAQVLDIAISKDSQESQFRASVRDGVSPSDAFKIHGVL